MSIYPAKRLSSQAAKTYVNHSDKIIIFFADNMYSNMVSVKIKTHISEYFIIRFNKI